MWVIYLFYLLNRTNVYNWITAWSNSSYYSWVEDNSLPRYNCMAAYCGEIKTNRTILVTLFVLTPLNINHHSNASNTYVRFDRSSCTIFNSRAICTLSWGNHLLVSAIPCWHILSIHVRLYGIKRDRHKVFGSTLNKSWYWTLCRDNRQWIIPVCPV